MTDSVHLQAALERLRDESEWEGGDSWATVESNDLRLLLTSHAALLARVEAAESALRQVRPLHFNASFGAMTIDNYFAAHPQPQAPVMGGEGA